MIYKHKWVNDWARYVAADEGNMLFEFSEKPEMDLGEWLRVDGRATRIKRKGFTCDDWSLSLIQRYTDQQMELETQGWTLCEEGECPIDRTLLIDLYFEDGEGDHPGEACMWTWKGSERPIIAYRLSNADGYKDGVKVESNEELIKRCFDVVKPKWKAGELPPVNIEFEIFHHGQWFKCFVLMYDDGIAWVKQNTGHCSYNIDRWLVRPIQTDRERVIAKAYAVSCETIGNPDTVANSEYRTILISSFYDAGMLIDPDKGEE